MSRRSKIICLALAAMAFIVAVVAYIHGHTIDVLSPKGTIAAQERSLMITSTLLMLVVVIPVFILTFFIAWKYREGNSQDRYTPDWDHHLGMELTWWAVPGAIILILAAITWHSSHALDPYKSIASTQKPLNIEVVALQWKWLFIYPEQDIATVDYMQVPVNTPISLHITSDAPMNSFWVPQLGGQIYAMSGMDSQLHLMASQTGDYRGVSANISGAGFAGMNFTVRASSGNDFNKWVRETTHAPNSLNLQTYTQLAKPSEVSQPIYYSSTQAGLYDDVIMKYMMPGMDLSATPTAPTGQVYSHENAGGSQ
jgi:cytochrome o ubiquinol oxidase subunit 2